MATHLTTDDMKAFVREHFEDFVNNKQAEVIRHNMTPDFSITTDRAVSPRRGGGRDHDAGHVWRMSVFRSPSTR